MLVLIQRKYLVIMFTHKLKPNPDKTEFMLIGNKHRREKFNSWLPVEILSNSINPASHARILGVTSDADFNFQPQINNTVKSCNYYIRDIARIHTHLSLYATIALENALVSSRLDYCYSLLHSAKVNYLDKL